MTYKKLSDLTLDELDNTVAKIEGVPFSPFPSSKDYFSPTTCWEHGGPLIDKYTVDILSVGIKNWRARMEGGNPVSAYGQTPLIAAMRCIVRSKLGDTVEI